MSQYVVTPTKTFTAGGAIAQFLRVKTAALLVVAGATDNELGTMENASFASGDNVAVRLRTAQGTVKMVAVDAITVDNPCYAAAGGKISATGTLLIGIALESSTADGDIIEVLRRQETSGASGVTQVTEKHTAGDTLTAAESGSTHSNTGASGTITLVLPAATVGLVFNFYVGAAFELRIDPSGTQTIALPSSGVQGAAGKYLVADAVGEHVRLICETAGAWNAFPYAGTWTAEA